LAILSSSNITEEKYKLIVNRRSILMNQVFYKYASSGEGSAKIDKHYIIMALDQWSWFWIFVEASVLLFITAIVVLSSAPNISFWLLVSVITLIVFMYVSYKKSGTYAYDEVIQILLDAHRKTEVRAVFNNIQ
jgi:hypothetical protein